MLARSAFTSLVHYGQLATLPSSSRSSTAAFPGTGGVPSTAPVYLLYRTCDSRRSVLCRCRLGVHPARSVVLVVGKPNWDRPTGEASPEMGETEA
jgi:hypothetical protein